MVQERGWQDGEDHVLYEGSGDDDAGAEVARKQIDIDGYPQPWHFRCKNREEGGSRGHEEDDEEG